MAISILQSDEQVAPRKAWLGKLVSTSSGNSIPNSAARQKQAEARLAHLATQHSAVAKAEQARAELRKYSIG